MVIPHVMAGRLRAASASQESLTTKKSRYAGPQRAALEITDDVSLECLNSMEIRPYLAVGG